MAKRFISLFSFLFYLTLILIGLQASCQVEGSNSSKSSETINGVCLVAPREASMLSELHKIERISPSHVAVIPYAFQRQGESRVNYSVKNPYWWGEGVEGARETIQQLKALGYKIMLKPHVWVVGEGWPGDFDPTKRVEEKRVEMEWSIWEDSYRDYIIKITELAISEDVELYCIGTEYRQAVIKRPKFWKELISEVRSTYKGKLVYASNWDNYQNIPFWEELDYVGIDAYFPLSESEVPKVEELTAAWGVIKTDILRLADSCKKPILFTEYGYRSIPYTARGDWKNQEITDLNQRAQSNAYQALYNVWWNEPSFAGGFLWKWHPADSMYQKKAKARFTPQGKEVEKVIHSTYSGDN